jgi:hypothetical protein
VSVHNVDLFKISLNGLNFEQLNKTSTKQTFAAL